MAITKCSYSGSVSEVEDIHVGRVIEVRRYRDHRNMSDTMDYTDWQTVDCCDALVWLGPEGHPGNYQWNPRRPLEFHEQFMWVDCSNHFSDRVGFVLSPEVDADPRKGGDPLMWANLIAWRSHQEAVKAELIAQRDATARARHEQLKAEAEVKRIKEEKIAEAKVEAERLLRIYAPPKGTLVTVGEVIGHVFWSGTKFYRGAWRSTVGVKDKYGTAHWIDIKAWMPAPEKKSRARKSNKA